VSELKPYVVVTLDNDDKAHIHFTKAVSEGYAEFQVNEDYPDRDVVKISELPKTWQKDMEARDD
jgi:hypothetical protein